LQDFDGAILGVAAEADDLGCVQGGFWMNVNMSAFSGC
jgi:hypothetical protein